MTAPFKTCPCGRTYTREQWLTLKYNGVQEMPGDPFDLADKAFRLLDPATDQSLIKHRGRTVLDLLLAFEHLPVKEAQLPADQPGLDEFLEEEVADLIVPGRVYAPGLQQ